MSDPDKLLHLCWAHQEPSDCLDQVPCSWCPFSSTCVPNLSKIQILAPIYHADVCPLLSERWEIRTRLFGANISTITLLACIISMLAGLAIVAIVAVTISVSWKVRLKWKYRSGDWWKVWKYISLKWLRGWRLRLVDAPDTNSATPLLQDERDVHDGILEV
ncbi:hypothetical protein BGZ60DRAFT_383376 [Tricladium varicosporioides]|nr:hypothetical protein BGZ60DRAFT_383376 [Hymenoscyphus varicosporioides]